MGNNKDPNKRRPGEKQPGTFHYNPGNMSGEKIGVKEEAQEKAKADKIRSEREQQDQKR